MVHLFLDKDEGVRKHMTCNSHDGIFIPIRNTSELPEGDEWPIDYALSIHRDIRAGSNVMVVRVYRPKENTLNENYWVEDTWFVLDEHRDVIIGRIGAIADVIDIVTVCNNQDYHLRLPPNAGVDVVIHPTNYLMSDSGLTRVDFYLTVSKVPAVA